MTQLGVVAALPAEAKCLVGWPNRYRNISHTLPATASKYIGKPLLSISGIGPQAACTAATMLVEHGAAALLSWGCAGALSKNLAPGDLLIPRAVLAENGKILHPDSIWRKRLTTQLSSTLKWHEDMLVESGKMISGIEEKQTVAHTSGAIAVDMESAAIGRVARQAGIPFMVIRAVADSADEALPSCIVKMTPDNKQLQTRHLLPALISQPGLWPAMIRLGLHFRTATHTLGIVSRQSGPLFHIV